MLILTRKKDESIIIGDNIKIKVVELDNNRVQIGIDAPEAITIYREEIYQQIQEENRLAATFEDKFSLNLSDLLKKELKRREKAKIDSN
jgi:carbon storage regulator